MCIALPIICGATPLPPNSGVALTGTDFPSDHSLAGSNSTSRTTPVAIFSSTGDTLFSAIVEDRPLLETASNTYTFYRSIHDITGQLGITSFAVDNFAGFTVDVNYRTDSLGTAFPVGASRTPAGNLIRYVFDPAVFSPEDTHLFFARTDATAFDALGSATLMLTNGNIIRFAAFEPITSTDSPEPATFALIAAALLAAVVVRRVT
jgi:hypothetical protein